MAQAIKTPPRTKEEYRRQKGPVPLIAIALVLGLLAAFLVYYGPALYGSFKNYDGAHMGPM